MKIIIDTREQYQEFEYLKKIGVDLERRKLDVGDYKIEHDGYSVVVERKEITDFINSMYNDRLRDQLTKLSKEHIPILLITGSVREFKEAFPLSKVTQKQVHAMIASAVVRYGLRSVIWVTNDGDNYVHNDGLKIGTEILKALGAEKLDKIPDRRVKKSDNHRRSVVKVLFNIPSNVAERLLERFGSIWNIINATDEELLKVKGMGKKRVDKARSILGGFHA